MPNYGRFKFGPSPAAALAREKAKDGFLSAKQRAAEAETKRQEDENAKSEKQKPSKT